MKSLSGALDRFPASTLNKSLAIIKRLLVWSEAAADCGQMLNTVSLSKLVDAGFRPAEIRDFIDVAEHVHENKYGRPKSDGIAGQPPPSPKIEEFEGEARLQGLMWVPLAELDSEISRRNAVSPSHQMALTYNLRDGIVAIGSNERECPLTRKEYECMRFIHKKGAVRLKEVAAAVKSTEPNTSRFIGHVNRKFAKALGAGHNLIRSGSMGYSIDQARFSVSGS